MCVCVRVRMKVREKDSLRSFETAKEREKRVGEREREGEEILIRR